MSRGIELAVAVVIAAPVVLFMAAWMLAREQRRQDQAKVAWDLVMEGTAEKHVEREKLIREALWPMERRAALRTRRLASQARRRVLRPARVTP